MSELGAPEQAGPNPVTILVQLAGLVIMLGGLYSASQVVSKGWTLLEKPAEIVPFAEEIERQTQINRFSGQFNLMFEFFSRANSSLPASPSGPAGGSVYDPVPYPTKTPPGKSNVPPTPPSSPVTPNIAYFAAWLITIVLMGLIARISLWAVVEGGKLVIFSGNQDRQLRRVISELAMSMRGQASVDR